MSETKELVEFLDETILVVKKSISQISAENYSEQAGDLEENLYHLTKIKGIVELHESEVHVVFGDGNKIGVVPDDDLVEDLTRFFNKWVRAEVTTKKVVENIIKYFQSRQTEKVTVKEEDIEEWYEKRDDAPQAGDWMVEDDLIDLVKFLGFEVVK